MQTEITVQQTIRFIYFIIAYFHYSEDFLFYQLFQYFQSYVSLKNYLLFIPNSNLNCLIAFPSDILSKIRTIKTFYLSKRKSLCSTPFFNKKGRGWLVLTFSTPMTNKAIKISSLNIYLKVGTLLTLETSYQYTLVKSEHLNQTAQCNTIRRASAVSRDLNRGHQGPCHQHTRPSICANSPPIRTLITFFSCNTIPDRLLPDHSKPVPNASETR